MDAEIQTREAAAYTGAIHASQLGITDFTGLEEFILLDSLECSGNAVWYYDQQNSLWVLISTPLLNVSANTALTYLNCANNQLTNLDVSANIALIYLTCMLNSLTSLDVSACTALTYLNTGDDGVYMPSLTSLNVSGCSALTYLHCSGNSLTSLNVSSCTELSFLDCYGNSLSSLDVTANTALTTLICGVNQLTSLDVSANTALTDLICWANQLTSLDVSANTALIYLSCGANQLSNLNVAASTALTNFYCGANQLTSLDVSANTALTTLDCTSNQLTSIDVSANTALTTLDCSANQLSNLNVKNGNNMNMDLMSNNCGFLASNNPNLSCIEVDNVAWSNTNWANDIDATAYFSENCSGAGLSDINSNAPMFYPNPTTGTLYLSEPANISLIDLSGKLLLEEKNTNQLDLSALPAGMYFLSFGENNLHTYKVIKE
jgi:Leucine-rich repeat (LRR) protein